MNELSDAIFVAIAALIFFGIPLLILWPELFSGTNQPEQQTVTVYQQKPVKSPQKPSKSKPRNAPSMDTIEALHLQADAERVIAEALEGKAQRIHDPVKRARIDKQAKAAWVRFNSILDQIDRITEE